jgi:hypothetical protein
MVQSSLTETIILPDSALVEGNTVADASAPTAICQNVMVAAGPGCVANASIDDGSFDPDGGDTITLIAGRSVQERLAYTYSFEATRRRAWRQQWIQQRGVENYLPRSVGASKFFLRRYLEHQAIGPHSTLMCPATEAAQRGFGSTTQPPTAASARPSAA